MRLSARRETAQGAGAAASDGDKSSRGEARKEIESAPVELPRQSGAGRKGAPASDGDKSGRAKPHVFMYGGLGREQTFRFDIRSRADRRRNRAACAPGTEAAASATGDRQMVDHHGGLRARLCGRGLGALATRAEPVGSATEAIARNPGAVGDIRGSASSWVSFTDRVAPSSTSCSSSLILFFLEAVQRLPRRCGFVAGSIPCSAGRT